MAEPRLLVNVEKRLAGFHLQARLMVEAEILVLFGPSGAGKTTLLNAVAGLTTPDSGEIALDGALLFRKGYPGRSVSVPARKRGMGYVFQAHALFPHMTALENVGYALWREADWRQRALALLERVDLAHLTDRYPDELSGGQQQRVAISRALATNPKVLLLDEPFSALDSAVRERLQNDLRAIQIELGLIVLYVTHRLEDAFALGQRLAVIREGCVEQVGPIEEVFRRPASARVAEVMGVRNLFRVRVADVTPAAAVLDWEGLRLEAPAEALVPGTEVIAYIQPEDIKVLYPDRPVGSAVQANQVDGVVIASQANAGARTLRVELLANGQIVELRFPSYSYAPLGLLPGERVRLSLRKAALAVLSSDEGAHAPTKTDRRSPTSVDSRGI